MWIGKEAEYLEVQRSLAALGMTDCHAPPRSSKGRSENAEALVAGVLSIGICSLLINQRNAFLTCRIDLPEKAPI